MLLSLSWSANRPRRADRPGGSVDGSRAGTRDAAVRASQTQNAF